LSVLFNGFIGLVIYISASNWNAVF